MSKMNLLKLLGALALACALASACGSNSGTGGVATHTGQTCQVASECYPSLEAGSLRGEPVCLDRVTNGYCTHHCATDTDCCAVPGECPQATAQVCAPFESTGELNCFLSCEDADLKQFGYTDSTAYCQNYANAAFICRSTGGGSKNRKVCVPNG